MSVDPSRPPAAAVPSAAPARSRPPVPADNPDRLEIAGRSFSSRLILGTGGFVNHELLAAACRETAGRAVHGRTAPA